jgi:hypothetical protein
MFLSPKLPARAMVVCEPKVGRLVGRLKHFLRVLRQKKQGAAGITTAAPYIAG